MGRNTYLHRSAGLGRNDLLLLRSLTGLRCAHFVCFNVDERVVDNDLVAFAVEGAGGIAGISFRTDIYHISAATTAYDVRLSAAMSMPDMTA
jgi:hypothetical protein